MEFAEWERYYEKIVSDFGFSREADEHAARLLDGRLNGIRISPESLRPVIAGQPVTVAGNAVRLENELHRLTRVVIAADEATSVLLRHGRVPQVIVTDLDGNVDDQLEANRAGSVAVVHGHGDNIPAIEKWVDRFTGKTMATTQARPFGRVYNFGGFTDGDRGVFLADVFGARSIRLVGFDFERPNPKDEAVEVKKRKLDWAYILIQGVFAEREAFETGLRGGA